ncbi:unnamed protein product, partial [Brassica rapa]
SPKQSTGRASVLSPRTSVLICVLMDSHRRPVCADGHTWTHTNVLCVLTDTHGRPVCADGQPQTATNILYVMCVLADTHGRPVCTDQTAHVGQNHPNSSREGASVLTPRTNVLICVLMDSHGRPLCADGHRRTHTEAHTRTHTDSHGRTLCAGRHPRTSYSPRGPKSPKQSTGRASMLSPRTNVLICVLMDSHGRPVTNVLICVLMDSHGRPLCADGHTRT